MTAYCVNPCCMLSTQYHGDIDIIKYWLKIETIINVFKILIFMNKFACFALKIWILFERKGKKWARAFLRVSEHVNWKPEWKRTNKQTDKENTRNTERLQVAKLFISDDSRSSSKSTMTSCVSTTISELLNILLTYKT